MIVTLDEAKEFLKIDYSDDDNIITMIINAAEQFIDSAIDDEVDKTTDKVKTITLFLITDMYDKRSFMDDKGSSKIRDIAKMMLLQL